VGKRKRVVILTYFLKRRLRVMLERNEILRLKELLEKAKWDSKLMTQDEKKELKRLIDKVRDECKWFLEG